MGYSSDVTAGDKAEATQYNNLRKDVINTTGGHDHDGSDSKKVDTDSLTGHTKTAHDALALDHGGLGGLTDDDHTQYRLESADHTHQSTGLQAGQLDHGLALSGLTDDDHTQYRLESEDHTHQSTGAQAGKLDHGLALDGLTDDDHTQYTKKATLTEQGDVYYASAASTPAALAHGTSGQVLATGGHGANPSWVTSGAPTIVRKTADENTTGSSLQNDNELLLAVGASEKWLLEIFLIARCNADSIYFKYGITAPAGATICYGDPADNTYVNASGNEITFDNIGSTYKIIHILCLIVVSTTAGNLQLQWCRVNSGTAYVAANSCLIAHKLA